MSVSKSIYKKKKKFKLHNRVRGVEFKHIYEKFVWLRRLDLIRGRELS
jgi:hypothetical protein